MHKIYIIKNNINNKIYIGQTGYRLSRRWSGHKSKALNKKSDLPIHNAIRKYGADNFSVTLIEECDKSLVNNREIYWIDLLNATDRNIGYNLSTGGNTFQGKNKRISPMKGKKHTEQTKKIMSQQRRGSGNGMFGKRHSNKSKNKMSQNSNRRHLNADHPMFGKHHTPETILLISQNRKNKTNGEKHPSAKLTEKLVLEIRDKYLKENISCAFLAKEYGVGKSTVEALIARKTWKHI